MAPRVSLRFFGLWPGWTLLFALLSVASVLPFVWLEHPPLQDLPQHLAAISVLRHYPDLGLGQYFDIELSRTQYLAYYGAAYLLSFPLGIALANKLLLCAAVIALPWSLAALLHALGRDPRMAVFAFGLTYNAHLVLGFFNFVAAIPIALWGLALAVELRREPSLRRDVGLASLLVLCFYTHIVPFAFLALGSALVLIERSLRTSLRRAAVFAPALIASLVWLSSTPAGSATLAAAGGAEGTKKTAQFASVTQAVRELPMWLTDVINGTLDEQLLVAWGALLLTAMALGVAAARGETAMVAADAPAARLSLPVAARVALLCPLAFVAYFTAPTSYDWIWPISARFPLLALLFAVLLVPRLRGAAAGAVILAAALIAALSFRAVGNAFASFERDEVGDIDAALEVIPPGERVLGLIFDRGSREVRFAPFLHYAALYQAQKGGAVMFTFADFPQSPFRFKPDHRPPKVPPRWEWQPEKVDPARDLGWYHYVLIRGVSGKLVRQLGQYERVFNSPRWSVWRRR